MAERKELVAWIAQQLPSIQALAPNAISVDAAESLAKLTLILEDTVPIIEHDRRVTELLEANNKLLFRARRAEEALEHQRRKRHDSPPAPTHRHWKGDYCRLHGVLWAESNGEMTLHYSHVRTGRQRAILARDFFSTVDSDGLIRRFEPVASDCLPVDCWDAQISLFEYCLLANATLIEGGAPAALVQRYSQGQWESAWRDGISPEDAATDELAAARAA